jgi:hypothetical protein
MQASTQLSSLIALFSNLPAPLRQAALQQLTQCHSELREEEKRAGLRSNSVLELLRMLASISHSIGTVRRQLKGTEMKDYDLDHKWKTQLTVRLIAWLKEVAPNHRLLELGKFTDFIEQLDGDQLKVVETVASRPGYKDQLIDLCLEFRRLERTYITRIQEWRNDYPKSTVQLQIFDHWPSGGGHYGSSDDLDAVIAYCVDGYNREAHQLINNSHGCENEEENWRLTEKQCRQLRVQYPARLQGLHH